MLLANGCASDDRDAGPAAPEVKILAFDANPKQIEAGGSFTISWDIEHSDIPEYSAWFAIYVGDPPSDPNDASGLLSSHQSLVTPDAGSNTVKPPSGLWSGAQHLTLRACAQTNAPPNVSACDTKQVDVVFGTP
jgi:hypothetical protein